MELRAYQEGRAKKLAGYAATYNRKSKTLYSRTFGYFREKILPGAFDGVVRSGCPAGCECKSCSIYATINHDDNLVLGRVGAGTLKLTPDDKGLRFVITLPDVGYANDLYENVRNGNMSGCSFTFNSDQIDDEWNAREGGNEISTGAFDELDDDEGRGLLDKAKAAAKSLIVRTIKKFRALTEIAVVSNPAYNGTSVSARSLAAAVELRSRLGYEPQGFKRNPGLVEDAGRRARVLEAAMLLPPTWPGFDANGLVDTILEARKLAAKSELNTIEHRRFWFCVDAITDIKQGMQLANLEHNYRKELLEELGPAPLPALHNRFPN